MSATLLRHAAGFHQASDAAAKAAPGTGALHFTYTFENFFHPHVGRLIGQLNRTSLAALLDPPFLDGLHDAAFFAREYTPLAAGNSRIVSRAKEIDVSVPGPYAIYNWELFYHIPVTIAVHLSNTQRFAEAQKWFHYVFDPTRPDPWRFLAFEHGDELSRIDDLLVLLSTPDSELTSDEVAHKHRVHDGYAAILASPFRPHVVARVRPTAYQYYVLMKYLDNLIAWGDSLFLQDTIETINEASLSYVLAANC